MPPGGGPALGALSYAVVAVPLRSLMVRRLSPLHT